MQTTLLCSLDDLKTWLGVTGTGQDGMLTRLITAASAFIESWLSRTVAVTDYTETRDGNNTMRLMLRHYPVAAITSVSIDGVAIGAAGSAIENGYVFDDKQVLLRGYRFTHGYQNVTIVYSAGLSSNAPNDVPGDLQQACIELAALKYRRRMNEGNSSKSIQGETVAFVTADMPKPVATLLSQYRNVVPV